MWCSSCIYTEEEIDIYMLVEKEYPLSQGVMVLMLTNRLTVDEDNEMARDLLQKIFEQANRPKQR